MTLLSRFSAIGRYRRWASLFCFTLAGLLLPYLARAQSNPQRVSLTISAAADLALAFQELGALFEKETGINPVFNFGSTGQLAQQIEQGAPVDLFAAANIDFVNELEKQGLILPDTKALYARGRITLWTRSDSSHHIDRIEDLVRPEVKQVAIANPEHAPYGIAAREAMQSVEIWEKVQPKLVFGENVRQTLLYAETGNVDVAIVALSLSVQGQGRWVLVPQELHKPIDQALAVIKGTRHEQEARRFAAFINGPEGRPVMRKYGFILPGEEAAQ
ncbi:MAG TPA: molybdate ABC transporter substrate-binding protein [Candidatus Binatia bacterium]|jgi:molybdate transport system substrate-binding protein|nr:molybdate ABC transporter substrate-binding protein [Candidatus Binatia bacterium]